MKNEYEIVEHLQIKYLNIFIVRVTYRTPHAHNDIEINLVLDGQIILRKGKDSYPVKEKEIFIINSMEPHEIITESNGALILSLQISPKLMKNYFPASAFSFFTPTVITDNLKAPYDKIISLLTLEVAFSFFNRGKNYEFRCIGLLNLLLYYLFSLLPWKMLSPEEVSILSFRADRIMRITNYIEENFRQKLLLHHIAEAEKLSVSYLSHFFKDNLNMTFQEYLNAVRFEYALQLIENTNMNIIDVCLESGFSDVRYLNKQFLVHFNCTPKDYRKMNNRQKKNQSSPSNTQQAFYSDADSIALLAPFRNELSNSLSDFTEGEILNPISSL